MSKLLIAICAAMLLSTLACATAPKSTDGSERAPAADADDDSASDRLHHQKVLDRIDRIGGKRWF